MIVVGIDPAMRSLAVVCGGFVHKIYVNKSANKSFGRDREIKELTESLRNFLLLMGSSRDEIHIFIESPIQGGSGNVQTSVKIAMTVGAVYSLGHPSQMVAPASWKATVLGKGNGHATKETVAYWLKAAHPDYSALCDGDQDLVDATCIYLYGRKALGIS